MKEPQNIQIDWDVIIETIKAEKCILFLGPELFTNEQNEPLEKQLVDFLQVKNNPKVRVYDDGLFFFREGALKTLTYYKIKSFYSQSFPKTEALFEKIAQIPFHFIVATTPDKKMSEVFDRLNLKHNFDFYWKHQPPDKNAKIPSIKSPLAYNFFGCVDRQESLMLTHDDLFDYLESVFQGKSMPPKVRHHLIQEVDNFILLGLPFDKWYMQLLLRILKLHKDAEFVKYASNLDLDDETQTLCYDHFRINFVPNNVEGFINEIYTRCKEAGILRKSREEQTSILEQLIEWLSKDEIEQVFHSFTDFLNGLGEHGKDLHEDLTLLMNRHRRLLRKINQGIVDNGEANRESNKLRKNLLELINEAKAFE